MRGLLIPFALAFLAVPASAWAQASYTIEVTRNSGSGGTADEFSIVCNTGNATGNIAGYKLRYAGSNGNPADLISSVSATAGTTSLAPSQCFLFANTAFDDFSLATTYPIRVLSYTVVGYATYTPDVHANGSIAFTTSGNVVQGSGVKFGNNGNTGFTPSQNPGGTATGDDAAFRNDTNGTYSYGGGALPVELAAFAGVADGTAARLTWTTMSETNNLGFYVEQQRGDVWHDASALIAGHGTSTEQHAYAHTVSDLAPGTHRFRLRQLDTDGTVHLSDVVAVEIAPQEPLALTLLGHGTAQPRVRIVSAELATYDLAVVDVLGRILVQDQHEVSGTFEWTLPAPLASGVYVVRVAGARGTRALPLHVR